MSEQVQTPPPAVERDTSAHTLPTWVNWLQDNVFLSALLLAEAYLLGNIMAMGWVPSVANINTWDLYHGIGAGLFFAAGACGAGVALSCSLRAATAFQRREWGFAIGNLFGLFMFSVVEIWASIAERSSNLPPTPADDAVLRWMGVTNAPISPTVVMIAVFFPFVTLFYGFSRQKRIAKPVEDPETLRARLENQRIIAQHNAEMRQIGAAGVRGAAGALFGGNAATVAHPLPSAPDGHVQRVNDGLDGVAPILNTGHPVTPPQPAQNGGGKLHQLGKGNGNGKGNHPRPALATH